MSEVQRQILNMITIMIRILYTLLFECFVGL